MNPPDDPIHSACGQGDLSAVTDLISRLQKSDPSYKPPFPTILYAATSHDCVNVAKYCLDHHAVVTPDIMRILLINRAKTVYELFLDSNAVDANYYIPWFGDILSHAARRNDFEWAHLCLSHGADPNRNLVDEHKSILASVAESEKGTVKMAELLIGHGALVKGSGAIVMAAEEGKLDMVKFLLEEGAEIDEMGIEHPTDPRFIEDVGTPLHRAVVGSHSDVVRFLLAKGADVGARDGRGRLALDLATGTGEKAIVEMLEQRGGAGE